MQLLAKNPTIRLLLFFISGAFVVTTCSPTRPEPTPTQAEESLSQPATVSPTLENPPAPTEVAPVEGTAAPETASTASLADVISVAASGSEEAFQFLVEIRSPDTGCEQYADWWEVVGEDGELIYRRVLLHSHVNEQPFRRSGGPVAIDEDTVVIVRAHMNSDGYGGAALQGSINAGFEAIQLDPDFAADLEEIEPLPTSCGF